MSSVKYYNENAQEFYDRTIAVDMSHAYEKFLALCPKGSHILDAGCGVGRDAKYFLEKGYEVEAFDGSIEMVKKASQVTGKEVMHQTFQELDCREKFDAVWACASLLHVPYSELPAVLQQLQQSLKKNGILYASFKFGGEERAVSGRSFFDQNEETICSSLQDLFEIIEIWQTPDLVSRVSPSPAKAWLNLLCRKV